MGDSKVATTGGPSRHFDALRLINWPASEFGEALEEVSLVHVFKTMNSTA